MIYMLILRKKTIEQIFEILILKFLANFSNVTFVLSLWNSSCRAIWADRPPLVVCFSLMFMVWLSVPVHLIDRTESSPKWPNDVYSSIVSFFLIVVLVGSVQSLS